MPVAEEPVSRPAEASPGRVATGRCLVTLTRQRLRPWLRVVLANQIIVDRPIGGFGLSVPSLRWMGGGCGIIGLAAAAAVPHPWNMPMAATSLVEGMLLVGLARASEPSARMRVHAVIDAAWDTLAPSLAAGEDLGRLALASIGRGRVRPRTATLDAAISRVEQAMRSREPAPGTLAALWCLRADDCRRTGRDPVPELAARLGDCFSGALPLGSAAGLAELVRPLLRQREDRARLRILAIEQAFEHGLGVWDMIEIGKAFPPLGQLLITADLDGLARLRMIWDRRAERPWNASGPAMTAFELARYPLVGGRALAELPICCCTCRSFERAISRVRSR